MLNKIHKLDENPELYKDIMKQCQDCIKPEYLDVSDLNNTLFDHFNKDVII